MSKHVNVLTFSPIGIAMTGKPISEARAKQVESVKIQAISQRIIITDDLLKNAENQVIEKRDAEKQFLEALIVTAASKKGKKLATVNKLMALSGDIDAATDSVKISIDEFKLLTEAFDSDEFPFQPWYLNLKEIMDQLQNPKAEVIEEEKK